MSRRKPAQIEVPLFPFLAVLVSTMGALILLLLVITRQVQVERLASDAKAANLPPLPEIEAFKSIQPLPPFEPPAFDPSVLPPLPEIVDRRPTLASRKEALEQRLKQPATVSDSSRLALLTESLESLETRIRALASFRKARSTEIAALKTELADAQSKKQQLERQTSVENRFAIVPYDGPNGTNRRPIFLECRKSSVTLQPEGIALDPADFQKVPGLDNPLTAMVRSLIEKRKAESPEHQPYPLVIIRPDGIAAYFAVRSALAKLDVAIGYELVDEGVALTFPPVDPQIKQIASEAVVENKQRREATLASAGGLAGGFPALPGMRGGGSGSGAPGRSGMAGPARGPFPIQGRAGAVGTPGSGPWDGIGGRQGTQGPELQGPSQSAPNSGLAAGTKEPGNPGPLAAIGRHEPRPPNRSETPGTGPAAERGAGRSSNSTNGFPSIVGRHGEEETSITSNPDQREGTIADRRGASAESGAYSDGAAAGAGKPRTFDDLLQPKPANRDPAQFAAEWEEAGEADASRGEPGGLLQMPPMRRSRKRPVTLECRSGGVVIYPQKQFLQVSTDDETGSAIPELYKELRAVITSWGPAGRGQRWQPVLTFYVRPDGLENYYRLRAALVTSGLDLEHRIIDWATLFELPNWQGWEER